MSESARSIPILPVLSTRELVGGSTLDLRGILEVGNPSFLNSGTSAIAAALRLSSVGNGSTVLLPAFNCPSMVEAILAVGASPHFYRVSPELTIAPEHIAEKLRSDTRAVLVPHLFNQVQPLTAIRELCDAKRIVLIEDCAHAMFGMAGDMPVGSLGHFAVASPRKFLPLIEGGILTSRNRMDVSSVAEPASWTQGARTLFDAVDVAVRFGRLKGLAPLIATVKRLARGNRKTSGTQRESATGARVHIAHATWATRFLARRSFTASAMLRRQRNYEYLVRGLRSIPGARVLDPHGVVRSSTQVPYMVPLLLRDPAHEFAALKALGVPMWRWEYSARGHCDVTDWYAQALVQLPCHQSLTAFELNWMLERLGDVFSRAQSRTKQPVASTIGQTASIQDRSGSA